MLGAIVAGGTDGCSDCSRSASPRATNAIDGGACAGILGMPIYGCPAHSAEEANIGS
jgi:hypothetical protein